jgi:glutamate-ammonia-ligase adenylyltransferase
MALRHGRVAGGVVAILGMGKLGSRELTAGSDVDLILLYDHDEDAEWSDGEKPLAPSHYYARLTQRLIAAVSAPTAQGVLYELDLRLRPSGNKGPVATHIDSFVKYQREQAWTWEHMALTRARPLFGSQAARGALNGIVREALLKPREREPWSATRRSSPVSSARWRRSSPARVTPRSWRRTRARCAL